MVLRLRRSGARNHPAGMGSSVLHRWCSSRRNQTSVAHITLAQSLVSFELLSPHILIMRSSHTGAVGFIGASLLTGLPAINVALRGNRSPAMLNGTSLLSQPSQNSIMMLPQDKLSHAGGLHSPNFLPCHDHPWIPASIVCLMLTLEALQAAMLCPTQAVAAQPYQ